MKKILLALGLIGFSTISNAQNIVFDWVHHSTTTDQAHGYASAISPDGGVVTVGDFRGSCNLDPLGGTAPKTSNGGFDGFVQALDSTGAYKWSYAFGSSVTGGLDEQAMVVGVATSGDVYVAGRIRGTTVFQGASPVTVGCAGGVDVVLFKLNSVGQLQWAFSIGSNSNDMPTALKVQKDGSVLLAGTFVNTVDFDPGNDSLKLSTGGTLEGFLANYDPAGNLNWAVAADGAGTVRFETIDEMNNGDIIVGGQISGAANFNFSGNTLSLTSPGGLGEAFVMKMNSMRAIQWLTSFTPTGGNSATKSVSVDRGDNVYLAGYFANQITFGTTTYTTLGDDDCFYAKLNSGGQLVWSQHGGAAGSFDQSSNVVARPDSGAIFLTTTNTNNFALQTASLPGPALGAFGGDFFMMLDDAGNFVWADGVDEMPLNTTFTMSNDGKIYFSGSYMAGQDFDFGPVNTNTSCSGSADMFIARYKTPIKKFVSLAENSMNHQLMFYPNPATDKISVTGTVGALSIELLDMQGKSIRNFAVDGNQNLMEISVTGLPAGVYLAKVHFKGSSIIHKLSIQ